ncbi:MAG TPA: sugar phosphate nucleotidyltransferase [Coriobacteriia bacterium]
MKAVIMAGGEGTRLRPLTSLRPKPMVPVVNRPVMEHILGLCHWHHIDEVVATLQFMPQVIQDYFGDGEEWGVSISYAVEDTPMGTAGSVKNAQTLIGDDTFIVISGDALTDVDLTEVVEYHRSKGGAVTIVLKHVPDPLEFGVVITDEDGRIERFLEKPTWGQVFSDTINTGIYVCEPHVLDLVPDEGTFDFSAQLFPELMKRGEKLYGYITDAYWTDIGSLGSYMQANKDVLDRKVGAYIPGIKAANEVWIGEGADIDPDAKIGNHVVIGANVKVRSGAEIGDYAVIGDSCLIGHEASVQHSIVWSDSFIGAGAKVGGAVVCRRADIRARASLGAGSVIGDETMVGHGAIVGTDVAVYPFKRIESGADVTASLIWETKGLRALFGADGVSGLIGVDITPELALRLAQAYATTLPTGGHVVCSRDQSRAARMVKRAMVAGLNSAGVNVRDLRVASSAVNRFTTRDSRCVGGVHVSVAPRDPQQLEIHFYDKAGLDLAPGDEKKTERLYFRQEFRRSFFDQMGEIIYPPRALEYYTAGMLDALGVTDSRARVRIPQPTGVRMKVVAEMGFGVASVVLPQVAAGWGIDLISMRPFLDAERTYPNASEQADANDDSIKAVEVFKADFGVRIDTAAERVTLISPTGRVLDGDTALHALVELWSSRGCREHGDVAVPITASRVVEAIAGAHGCSVVRAGLSTRALSLAALREDVGFAGDRSGGYIFSGFLAAFDAVMTVSSIARLLTETNRSLDDVVAGLPEHHLVESAISCPSHLKGAVMRKMAEAVSGMDVEMTEGIRVERDDGWALVLPDPGEPIVQVFAEGGDAEGARALVAEYSAVVEEAIAAGR